jgi:hypothetical protein
MIPSPCREAVMPVGPLEPPKALAPVRSRRQNKSVQVWKDLYKNDDKCSLPQDLQVEASFTKIRMIRLRNENG